MDDPFDLDDESFEIDTDASGDYDPIPAEEDDSDF
jgi:hypothetical protein